MAETFHFELTSPEQTLVSADLSEAVLPGQEGDLAAMPGRALMIIKESEIAAGPPTRRLSRHPPLLATGGEHEREVVP